MATNCGWQRPVDVQDKDTKQKPQQSRYGAFLVLLARATETAPLILPASPFSCDTLHINWMPDT